MALFVRRPSMTKKNRAELGECIITRRCIVVMDFHRSIDRTSERLHSNQIIRPPPCVQQPSFLFLFLFFLSFLSFCFRVVVVSVLYRCCPFERHARHRTRLLIRKWSPSIPPQSSPTFHNDQVTMWDVSQREEGNENCSTFHLLICLPCTHHTHTRTRA